MKLPFVLGHCGWDKVTLIPADAVPPDEALAAALQVLDAPISGGLEVGFLRQGKQPGDIVVSMVDSTSRNWISMCGGMTQVIGKALIETFFREQFAIDTDTDQVCVRLITPSGLIPLRIDLHAGKVVKVTTVMDEFVHHAYARGVYELNGEDDGHMVSGGFVVMAIEQLERQQPDVDFSRRDAGLHLDLLDERLIRHMKREQLSFGAGGMLYDTRPDVDGQFRLYPRFYSLDGAAARIPYEFQCGTGTVAVGLVLAHRGMLPFDGSAGRIVFEWGNPAVTPDPYGVRTSELQMTVEGTKVTTAAFSHSVIEILAEGTLNLPTCREHQGTR